MSHRQGDKDFHMSCHHTALATGTGLSSAAVSFGGGAWRQAHQQRGSSLAPQEHCVKEACPPAILTADWSWLLLLWLVVPLRLYPAVLSCPAVLAVLCCGVPHSCGPMMLDVLLKIKDEQDQSLTLRRSCRCVCSCTCVYLYMCTCV